MMMGYRGISTAAEGGTDMAVRDAFLVVVMTATAPGPPSGPGAHDVILCVPLAQMLEENIGSNLVGAAVEAVELFQGSLMSHQTCNNHEFR